MTPLIPFLLPKFSFTFETRLGASPMHAGFSLPSRESLMRLGGSTRSRVNLKVSTFAFVILHYRNVEQLHIHLELAIQSNPPIPFQKLLDATTPIANGMS